MTEQEYHDLIPDKVVELGKKETSNLPNRDPATTVKKEEKETILKLIIEQNHA